MLRILFIGDIVGNAGRRTVNKLLMELRSNLHIDFVIANGENAAGGLGITAPTSSELFRAGIDVITLGNHTYSKKNSWDHLETEPRILRPLNYPPTAMGSGYGIFKSDSGRKIAVINLMGRVFMQAVDCPFRTVDTVLEEIKNQTDVCIVDMHAEATSEKIAVGHYLNGKVSAVIGTHTHVQTSDERILSLNTAFITDAGMTGVMDSVLGMNKDIIIEKFISGMPSKFELAEGNGTLNGVIIDIDETNGKACAINRLSVSE